MDQNTITDMYQNTVFPGTKCKFLYQEEEASGAEKESHATCQQKSDGNGTRAINPHPAAS